LGHQVVGVIAISLAFAAIIRGWGAPGVVAYVVAVLGMIVAAFVWASDTKRVTPGVSDRPPRTERAPATDGQYVPSRPVASTRPAVEPFFR